MCTHTYTYAHTEPQARTPSNYARAQFQAPQAPLLHRPPRRHHHGKTAYCYSPNCRPSFSSATATPPRPVPFWRGVAADTRRQRARDAGVAEDLVRDLGIEAVGEVNVAAASERLAGRQVGRHSMQDFIVFEAVLCWYQVVVEPRHEMNRHVDEVVVRHVVHRRLCAVYTRVCRHRSAPVASWTGDG